MWVREGHLRLHRGEDLWAVAMTVARALVGASIPRSSTNWPQCFVPFSKRGKVEREVFWEPHSVPDSSYIHRGFEIKW